MSESHAVSSSRSHESLDVGQQVYAVLEFVRKEDALWAKIESGHWDWLGVKVRRGRHTYVLGRPRASRSEGMASVSKVSEGAKAGVHGVEVRVPHPTHRHPGGAWYATAEEAKQEFARQVAELAHGPGSGLFKVVLIEDGQQVQEELVVRVLPNER